MRKLINDKSDVLIIFIKYPKAGFVKTRLAQSIGKVNAARLYQVFVKAVVRRTESKSFQRMIFYSPAGREKKIRNWLGRNIILYPQQGRTLGERLSQAFKFAFKNCAQRVIVIGSDSPTLDTRIILDAFRKLKDAECVIGPALDGGYYLIGLSSFYDGIFKGIRWGTKRVFNQTMNKLRQLKINYALLAESFDVDSYSDIILLKKEMQNAYRRNPLGLAQMYGIVRKLGTGNTKAAP